MIHIVGDAGPARIIRLNGEVITDGCIYADTERGCVYMYDDMEIIELTLSELMDDGALPLIKREGVVTVECAWCATPGHVCVRNCPSEVKR